MEFIRGSKFKLTGEVIVYSRVFGTICDKSNCLMKYASFNNDDHFIDSFRKLHEYQSMLGKGNIYVPFSKIPILMNGDYFFEEGSYDVIYAGNHLDYFECNNSLNQGLEYYKERFSKRKYNLEYLSELSPKERYVKILNGEEIKDYVNEEYFKLMKDYLKTAGLENSCDLDYSLLKQNFMIEFEELNSGLKDLTERFFNHFEFKLGRIDKSIENGFLSLVSSLLTEEFEKIDYKSKVLDNLITKSEEPYIRLKGFKEPIIFDLIDF
ncbi:hypothetical protein KY334_00365 [Candidatus Woesearchaeota archaeon]|nr:hypothetical protein [Candidatus Woesearchaeota archaeon]